MSSDPVERTLDDVARRLSDAERILFVTGAGLSADSGLPTYRGVGGLYEDRDTDDGVPIEVALSGSMFAIRPDLTWRYLWEIGASCAGAEPNDAHGFIARLTRERPESWVLTQNVDGLHRRADTRNLVELHGHAFDLLCSRCGREQDTAGLINGYSGAPPDLPPRCECGGVVRPDVVLFEEALPAKAVEALDRLESMRFDVVLAVGTSAMFGYVVRPITRASAAGVPTVEINPGTTDLTNFVRFRLPVPASEAARRLAARLWPE